MNTLEAIAVIDAAASAEALFGTDEPVRVYRRLAKLTHPDLAGARANAAFVRLTELWRQHNTINGYATGALAYRGDLANVYPVPVGHLKLARDAAVNDLLVREARALRGLADRGDPRYLPYVPRLVESFRHRDESGVTRRANVIATTVDGLVSLEEVARRRPDGLDPRDAAWMWRRLLVALGFAHRAGFVHGAVLAEHVLIEPADHGVVLIDWCYSAAEGELVPAIVPRHRDRYPEEVLARQLPGPYTDIHLAAGLMTDLMGDRAPKQLRAFAAGCQLRSTRQRPDDAWRLLGELDDLLHRLYGPRKFRPFVL